MIKAFFQMVACGIFCFLVIAGFFYFLELTLKYLLG